MNEDHNQSSAPRSLYGPVFLAGLLAIVIFGFNRIAPIILAVVLVLLIFLALNPIVVRLRNLSGGRTVPTALVVLAFLLMLGLTGWAFFSPIKKSTSKFVERLPQYWERIQKPLVKMEHKAVISEQKLKREVTTEVAKEEGTNALAEAAGAAQVSPPEMAEDAKRAEQQPGFIMGGIRSLFGGVSGYFTAFASNVAAILMVLITVFVGVVFSLLNPRPIIEAIFSLIPSKHHDASLRIAQRIARFVPRWALATLLGMAIIGVLTFFCMWPIFGFHDALVLGLIAMVLEVVPYAGPLLAGIPAVLLAMGEGGWTPLWVILIYFGIQTVENNIIAPVVVGGQLRLHPVGVIFSILVCATIFGVLGVLIAMPVLAVVRIIHQEIYRPKFLPNVSDNDLESLARSALNENARATSQPKPKITEEPSIPGVPTGSYNAQI